MWIFTKYGFFSIVYKDNAVNVRTRISDFLDKLHEKFPQLRKYPIVQLKNQDYQYRILVPQNVWDEVKDEFFDIDYSNFKSEVSKVWGYQHHYTELLHKLWTALYKYWDILESGNDNKGNTYDYPPSNTKVLPVGKKPYEKHVDRNAETITPDNEKKK